jgi:hypothetical protein
MACKLTIRKGANVWLLARTNRDAPSPEDVVESTAAFLIKTLGFASPVGTRGVLETVVSPKGVRRYYIGAARPVEISAADRPITDLPGVVYARRENCPEPELAFVEGQSPWYVAVEFDWRGNDVEIPWPRRRVNWLGVPSDSDPSRPFDWLLLQANFVGAEAKHEDSSLIEDVIDEVTDYWRTAKKEVEKALDRNKTTLTIALVAGVALGVVYLARKA